MFFELKISNILKSSRWGLEKSELPWEQNLFLAMGVFPVELLYQPTKCQWFALKLAKMALFMYLI